MKRLAQMLIVCTIAQAISSVRPGAQWTLSNDDYTTLNWLDTVQAKPTLSEVNTALAQCQSSAATLQQQIQSDLFALNVSTNTALQKLPALIDLLKQRGLLQ